MAINNIGDSQTFTYTAGIQSFSVTTKGLYKLEVWGGQGGKGSNSNTSIGGYGGYSVGYKVLDIGDILYVVCGGGLNSRYNGGGASTSGTIYCGHGAGATHIAAITGTLVDIGENNLDKILIVAGGGGGGGETTSRAGGGGGGLVGSNGKSGYTVTGGSQTSGGYNSYFSTIGTSHYTHGQFGKGGNAENSPTSGANYGGGGGGGLYGGAGACWSGNGGSTNGGGGGGSGYIDGVPEIVFNGNTYSPSTENAINNSGSGYATITLETIEAPYEITLIYDDTLGSAVYNWNNDVTKINLSAVPGNDVQFLGWYVNSVKISENTTYTYTVLDDTTIEARFEPIYTVTTSVSGNGSISYTRGIVDQNDIEINILPNANHHFVKYVIGQTEYTTTPLVLHLTADISITAYFEEDDRFIITVGSNTEDATIYLSNNDVYSGTQVTMFARPLADYYFVRWDDGNTNNPRDITVTTNAIYYAIYQRMADEPNIYPYRCYIKDQLHLTDAPKAFLTVKSFDLKTDLLTKANSTVHTIDKATNINNGDILVVYDPKGQTLYQGVIKSIKSRDDNTFGRVDYGQTDEMEITCSQMQSFYKGNWIYNTHSSSSTLEAEIAYILDQYAQGKIYNCSWTDALVAQRLGGITVQDSGSTSAHLPSAGSDYEIIDMEDFIYSLYENYGIILDFDINFSGANYVTIKVPIYETIKVGNNMFGIKNMSPITEIEETNKLIIYGTNKAYRTTYIATTNGIVQTPATTANRFNITNTEIVISDDALSDLVSANLPSTMYNHKLTFDLLIKNFVYQFGDFNLGGTLDVWYGEDYYNTVLTGYEIQKNDNQNITEVHFTCGKVRTALTKKLTMGTV